MAAKKCTPAQVEKAVKDSGGILATIARKLKINRHTVEKYLTSNDPEYVEMYADARKLLKDEIAMIGDKAESNIVQAIVKGDVEVSKWYCSTKLKNKGYTQRIEETGADGGEIVVKIIKGVSYDDI